MKLSLERLSARMRQGETIPLRDTAGVVLMLSIPIANALPYSLHILIL